MATDTTGKIIRKLKKQEKEEGKLPLLLEFYKKLLQIQSGAQKRIGASEPHLSTADIQARIEKGIPLVSLDELHLDMSLAREVFVEVLAVFAGYPQLFGDLPDKLKKPGAGRLLTRKAVEAWFAGKELPSTLTEGVRENLMQTVIQATLQPFLACKARALISSAKHESWRQGYCPICGGSPDMASLEKEVGARWLLCSRCDTEWRFQRLECPYCHTQDQGAMSFFTDDTGLYRLHVCEQCKCYLKTIDLRKTDSEILMPLERLYTLDMDKQAGERGYSPCQKPAVKRK